MPEEEAQSSPPGGGGENRAEEPAKTVYFVPIYAAAVVDPNKHVGKSRLPLDDQRQWTVGSSQNVGASQGVSPVGGSRGKAAEPEATVQQKRQKLIVMRKRGRIPEYDDDDPYKPTPKRLRNRMKAQKSRDKKKAYMNALEYKVKELEKTNTELEERCLCLQIEIEAMKNKKMTQLTTSTLESDNGSSPLPPEEAFTAVMGKDRPGRIRCAGSHETLCTWYGPGEGSSSSRYQQKMETLEETIRVQEDTIRVHGEEIDQLRSQVSELGELRTQLGSQQSQIETMRRQIEEISAYWQQFQASQGGVQSHGPSGGDDDGDVGSTDDYEE